jgi:hypothetical protein
MKENSPPTLFFEARHLEQFSEPITGSRLKQNAIYFALNFADKDLTIPHLEPVVFIGRNLDSGDEGAILYFQDLESYQQGIRYHSKENNETVFQRGSESEFRYIFEYERALDELMKCALRRRQFRT